MESPLLKNFFFLNFDYLFIVAFSWKMFVIISVIWIKLQQSNSRKCIGKCRPQNVIRQFVSASMCSVVIELPELDRGAVHETERGREARQGCDCGLFPKSDVWVNPTK